MTAEELKKFIGKKINDRTKGDYTSENSHDLLCKFIENNPSYVLLIRGKTNKKVIDKVNNVFVYSEPEDIIYTLGYSHFGGGGCGCCGEDIEWNEEKILLKIVDLNED